MSDFDTSYRELKPDIEELADTLFRASETLVRKRGAFLPHGALRKAGGEIQLMMAAPDDPAQERVSTLEMLPNLHDAMRYAAIQEDALAIAVCEDVRISSASLAETRAIKVLVEHRRGLSDALYLPFHRKLLGYSFGEVFAVPASPEVQPWPNTAAV